jgi:hypothetical protein
MAVKVRSPAVRYLITQDLEVGIRVGWASITTRPITSTTSALAGGTEQQPKP